MNEEITATNAATDTACPAPQLTDAELETLLASKPAGVFVTEPDEVTTDEATIH